MSPTTKNVIQTVWYFFLHLINIHNIQAKIMLLDKETLINITAFYLITKGNFIVNSMSDICFSLVKTDYSSQIQDVYFVNHPTTAYW